jgi:hypothetical protein
MMRRWPAFAATIAVAAATPASAQDRPPPPGWADPQAPEAPPVAGAPFVSPPPGVYPMPGPMPFPPPPIPFGPSAPPAPGFGYQYEAAAPQCGCGAPAYAYVWVPVQIRTNYVYSAAVEHVREVPEEHVVYREAVETRVVPVRGKAKYVKTAQPAKLGSGKTVRAAR